jgi:SAM-dependent methyltransferase
MRIAACKMRAKGVRLNDKPTARRQYVSCLAFHERRHSLQFRHRARVFEAYISRTPLAYALFRASECSALRELDIQRAALDVGSSTGEFAAWALSEPIEAGVDLSHSRLRQAFARGGHASLAQADAAALPYPDEAFASVLAVSVCEHLARPGAALAEAFRVLRPGGRFVATIVLASIHEHLFYARLCRALGLGWVARLYERLHDRVFDHVALHERVDWERMLAAAGFRLVQSRKILSPRLIRWFDFWLITAWPYMLMQWLGMRPRVWRPRWLARLCWKWFQSIDEDAGERGSVLLVVAEKPG